MENPNKIMYSLPPKTEKTMPKPSSEIKKIENGRSTIYLSDVLLIVTCYSNSRIPLVNWAKLPLKLTQPLKKLDPAKSKKMDPMLDSLLDSLSEELFFLELLSSYS